MMSSSIHSEQDPADRLCQICYRIDFDHHRYNKIHRRIKLGTWRDLVGSHLCPFCRLVVRSLTSNPTHMPRNLEDTIVLRNHLSWELGIEMSSYDKLKSEAHSTKFDLRSVSKRCKKLPYRLIVFAEQNPEEQGYIQYLAPPDSNEEETNFFGRAINREVVSTRLLRSWVRRCEDFHDIVCEENGIARRGLPDNLRLIDVRTREIIKAPTDRIPCYLTLSYVWGTDLIKQGGGNTSYVTERAKLRKDEAGRECTPLPEELPKTIADAVHLTCKLGYRYLWVDALCIVQDDPFELKRFHLERMDAIYNCSKLTIVAASGLHANSGLPGLSVPRRCSQPSERVKSFDMATMSPSFTDLENSRSLIWNTRGWTFQEKVLAKRLLLFTDYQVYYRCSESIWTEEIFMETEEPSKSLEARPAKFRWAADRQPHIPSKKLLIVKMFVPQLNVSDEWTYLGKFPEYAAAIGEYSQRILTDQRDVLYAIDGLLWTLRMDAKDFIVGLPEAHFLQSLLWHSEPGSMNTRINDELPTWTWASWSLEKGVVFDVLDVRLLRVIIIALRNAFIGIQNACSRMANSLKSSSRPSSSSSPPSSSPPSSSPSSSPSTTDSSTSTSTSSSSSAGHSSTPSSGSQGIPMGPPMLPFAGRDWTTLNATGKATVNVALCFCLPLMFQHHTVKDVYLYEDGGAHKLDCEEPLSFSTFTKDADPGDSDNEESRRIRRASAKEKAHASKRELKRHNRIAASINGPPVLSIKTVVVKLSIGACLSQPPPQDQNEAGVFELLNAGKCVGEVWTTLKHAKYGRKQSLEFLTISWGLSLQAAKIDESWIPRWDFDATILPKSNTKILLKCCQAAEEVMRWNSGKNLAGNYGRRKSASAVEEQPSVMAFFDALLGAKKGRPRPKFLWSTVNLLLIERDHKGGIARRIGTGRVIFEAWLLKWSKPEEVILA